MDSHRPLITRLRSNTPMMCGLVAATLLAFAGCTTDQPGADVAVMAIGSVEFPTTCTEEIQQDLEQGLALLHHMM